MIKYLTFILFYVLIQNNYLYCGYFSEEEMSVIIRTEQGKRAMSQHKILVQMEMKNTIIEVSDTLYDESWYGWVFEPKHTIERAFGLYTNKIYKLQHQDRGDPYIVVAFAMALFGNNGITDIDKAEFSLSIDLLGENPEYKNLNTVAFRNDDESPIYFIDIEFLKDPFKGMFAYKEHDKYSHFNNFPKQPITLLPEKFNTSDRIYDHLCFVLGIKSANQIRLNGNVKIFYKGGRVRKETFDSIIDLSKYIPDILLTDSSGSILPNFKNNSKKEGVTILDKISPKINIEANLIKQPIRTTDHIYNLTGEVTDDKGVAFIKVNGSKVPMDADGKFIKKVRLDLGLNSITVYAEDIYGNSDKKEIVIYRDEIIEEELEFSDVDIPFSTDNNQPNTIAVVIGIEDYKSVPKASYSSNDADIFREYLITTFGIPRKNIYFKLNENATKIEFDKIFSRNGWLNRNSSSSTDIIIYFAGHGAPDVDKNKGYIIPYDGDPYYTSSTCWSMATLYDNLSKIDANSITILLDACFSGGSRENQSLIADSRPIYIEVETGNIPENTIVFSASSGTEISSAYKDQKHGLFTYYFLKGLGSGADKNRDRKITASEMNTYLNTYVPIQAKKMGREQNPQLLGSDLNRIILRY